MYPKDYKTVEGIHFPYEDTYSDFTYTDGDELEKSIQDLIAASTDRSLFSKELTREALGWQKSCHLSPVRANLLRPLEGIFKKRTLELGAGCGVITRYLGELGGEVVALEASAFRAKTTRIRTEDLKNVEVVCNRIENFESEQKFDAVTMIGVLQYARLFSTCGGAAEIELLKAAKNQLAENGVLVIAIQNKLGLKYFAGYPEANAAQPYFGIENRYADDTIIRFDLDEIKKLLENVGLSHQHILFPFPDYHMAKLVLTKKALKGESILNAGDLVSSTTHLDRERMDWRKPNFCLEAAWQTIYEAGLADKLANSFLIVAGQTEKAITNVKNLEPYAWHYSTKRLSSYAIEKQFVPTHQGVMVIPSKVSPDNFTQSLITHEVEPEAYIQGELWWSALVNILKKPGWTVEEVAQWALPWINSICREAGLDNIESIKTQDKLVSGKLYDYTPFNCLRDLKGKFHFIDREWKLNEDLSLRHVIVRGLIGSFLNLTYIAKPAEGTGTNVLKLTQDILEFLSIKISQNEIKNILEKEINFQKEIISEQYILPSFTDYINGLEQIDLVQQPYHQLKIEELEKKLADLTLNSNNLQNEYTSLYKNTVDLRASYTSLQEEYRKLSLILSLKQKYLNSIIFKKLLEYGLRKVKLLANINKIHVEKHFIKNNNLVSIILPTFNRGHLISDAIESVLAQTYTNFELIIVDDGSTDNTSSILSKIKDPRVIYKKLKKNEGRSFARNTALEMAKGEYIAFLDSDDTYFPNKLELQVNYLNKNPNVSMIYTHAYCEDILRKIRVKHKAPVSGKIYEHIAFFTPVTILLPTVIVRRHVFQTVGNFDIQMHRFEDTDMWRRISKHYTIHALEEYTCLIKTHENNTLINQDPKGIIDSIRYYIDKIITEDNNKKRTLKYGINIIFQYYILAFNTVPKFKIYAEELEKLLKKYEIENGLEKIKYNSTFFKNKLNIISRIYNKLKILHSRLQGNFS